jgi:hypothetical protein
MKGFGALQMPASVMSGYESRRSWQEAGGFVSEASSEILAAHAR